MFWCSKQDSQSHTHRAYPHTHFYADKTLTMLVQWCVTAGVQPLVRQHGCCDRSEGEHHSHRTGPERQQSGRCRRRCTCRRTAGKGFDLQEVCVQGRLFAVTANVASQSRLRSGPRQLFFGRVRSGFFCLWFGGKRSLMSVSRESRADCCQVVVAQCQNQTGLFEF